MLLRKAHFYWENSTSTAQISRRRCVCVALGMGQGTEESERTLHGMEWGDSPDKEPPHSVRRGRKCSDTERVRARKNLSAPCTA